MTDLTNFRDNKYTPKVHEWDRERQILGEPMIHPSLIPKGYNQSWNVEKLCWVIENGLDSGTECACGKTKKTKSRNCPSCADVVRKEQQRLYRSQYAKKK